MTGSPNPMALDVAFGQNCASPLSSVSPCPQTLSSTWLSPYSNGPMYAATGYPACVPSAITGLCPGILNASSSLIADFGNSTYLVALIPVLAGTYSIVSTFLGGFISGSNVVLASPAVSLTVAPSVASVYVSPNSLNYIQTVAGKPSFFDLRAQDVYANFVRTNFHQFNLVFQLSGGTYSIALTSSSLPPLIPPQSLGNGTYRVFYLLELSGNYSVSINLIKADGSSGTSGLLRVEALHETCGYTSTGAISSTPYRCPPTLAQLAANQPGSCAASYSACSPSLPTCSGSTPVTCASSPALVCADIVQV